MYLRQTTKKDPCTDCVEIGFGLRLTEPEKRLSTKIPYTARVGSLSLAYYALSELNITNDKIKILSPDFCNTFALTLLSYNLYYGHSQGTVTRHPDSCRAP